MYKYVLPCLLYRYETRGEAKAGFYRPGRERADGIVDRSPRLSLDGMAIGSEAVYLLGRAV